MDRLDLQHHAFRLTFDGKLYRAPIPDTVQNVLDVGCGTGICECSPNQIQIHDRNLTMSKGPSNSPTNIPQLAYWAQI
jgi:hypothetical protein